MNDEFDVVDGPELEEDFDLDSEDFYPEHDDMYDIESALGSAGFGTDEWYGSGDYGDWDYGNDY